MFAWTWTAVSSDIKTTKYTTFNFFNNQSCRCCSYHSLHPAKVRDISEKLRYGVVCCYSVSSGHICPCPTIFRSVWSFQVKSSSPSENVFLQQYERDPYEGASFRPSRQLLGRLHRLQSDPRHRAPTPPGSCLPSLAICQPLFEPFLLWRTCSP